MQEKIRKVSCLFLSSIAVAALSISPVWAARSRLAGDWMVTSACCWGRYSYPIRIDGSGKIAGKASNGRVEGRASGNSVNMEFRNWLNKAGMKGKLVRSRIEGTYTQNLSSEVCRWSATRIPK
jgi:hypothetical protein